MRFFLVILLSAAFPASAQVTFHRTYDFGRPAYINQLPDSGYIMAGQTDTTGSALAGIVRLNPNGDTLWTNFTGTSQPGLVVNAVCPASDSGFIIAGSISSGSKEALIMKLGADGDSIWAKSFYNNFFENEIRTISQTTDGGYMLAGTSGNLQSDDLLLIRMDAAGDTLWTKTFAGVDDDDLNFLIPSIDGGFIMGGSTTNTINGYPDMLLFKIDSLGTIMWGNSYGVPGEPDYATEIVRATDGGYFIAGSSRANIFFKYDMMLVKTDSLGNLQWSKTFGELLDDFTADMITDSAGNVYILGTTNNFNASGKADNYLVALDSVGNFLWDRVYGATEDEQAFRFIKTLDGGFIIAGTQNSVAGNTCLIKLNELAESDCYENDPVPSLLFPVLQVTPAAFTHVTPFLFEHELNMTKNSGMNCYVVCSNTGLGSELQSPNFQIYPNPVSDIFYVTTTENADFTFRLYYQSSSLIFERKFTHCMDEDVSHFATGIYFFELSCPNKIPFRGKIMVTR